MRAHLHELCALPLVAARITDSEMSIIHNGCCCYLAGYNNRFDLNRPWKFAKYFGFSNTQKKLHSLQLSVLGVCIYKFKKKKGELFFLFFFTKNLFPANNQKTLLPAMNSLSFGAQTDNRKENKFLRLNNKFFFDDFWFSKKGLKELK